MLSIPNKIKQPSQCCVYCGKIYKTRTNLDKHIILCELVHKSKKKNNNNNLDDYDDIPSQKKLYKMLLELGDKYSKLEEKVDEMSKFIIKKKKKINVLEWLNTNITPEIIFDKLIDKIIILDEDIDYLINNSIYDTLNHIFSRNIYNPISETEYPIFAFIQKQNIFYIYSKVNDTDKDKETDKDIMWQELTKEKLIKFMNKVHCKISKYMFDWKKQRVNEFKNNDNLLNAYDKTMVKLMNIDFKSDTILNKIKGQMYQNMKTDMKAFIEYEFEF
jgi:hypothetical protein